MISDIGRFAATRRRHFRADTPVEAELRELERLRRMTTNDADRNLASKLIFKFRRAQRRLRFQQDLRRAAHLGRTGPCSEKNITKAMNPAVELQNLSGQLRPRACWPALIEEFFAHLFDAPMGDELPDRMWEEHPQAAEVTTAEVSDTLWEM